MTSSSSHVLEFGCPDAGETAAEMRDKLRFHTDSWDLAQDLKQGCPDIVVVDVRSKASYEQGHIPGAITFPHREITEASTRAWDRAKVYVTYCDGIGCNGSTKGAYKLAALGFRVKELLGGLDWWRRDQQPIVAGAERGSLREPAAQETAI